MTQADIKKYLEINLSFYGSLMLTIWYFANWFNDWHGSTDLLMWWFITPLFVVITGACGCRMWRGSDGVSRAPGILQSANASPNIRPKGLQRLLQFAGFFNINLATVVGLYFITTPFFDDGSTGYPVWGVLNQFMALSVIIAFADSLKSKLQLNATEAEFNRYIEVNTLFYALIVPCHSVFCELVLYHAGIRRRIHVVVHRWSVCSGYRLFRQPHVVPTTQIVTCGF